MSQSPLLELLASVTSEPETPLVVLDLDSTLFDVSPRLQKIIDNFAADKTHQELFPEATRQLAGVKTSPKDWGVKNAIIRAGVDSANHHFHKVMREFWAQSFFSHEYLEHDTPIAGAIEFVQNLNKAKISHAYLTGRDEPRMGRGSRRVLKKWGFPLSESADELILKPRQGYEDAEFKVESLQDLLTKGRRPIWLIDNEPLIINAVLKNLPQVNVIFFDSTHSGKAEVPTSLPRITDFRY